MNRLFSCFAQNTLKKILSFLIVMMITASAFAQNSADTAAPVIPSRDNDTLRYENAYQLFKMKRYDKALLLFGEYIEVYPDGVHRKESLKYIGDIYLGRFDYARAIKYYSMLYEEFSSEEEGIGGYYQTGICYSRMGKEDKAIEIFKEINSLYPASSWADKARLQLDLEEMLKDNPETITVQ